jgi:KDO2-lipid IV(A) lauroyltransferase
MRIDVAASFFGYLASNICKLLSVNRIADINLHIIFAHMSLHERKIIIQKMWSHLGKMIGEWVHFSKLSTAAFKKRVEIIDYSNGDIFKHEGALLISAHYGHWEIGMRALHEYGLTSHLVYRPANNPFVDRLIVNARLPYSHSGIKKGANGVRQIIKAIKAKQNVVMLVDQKMDSGIDVPFLGHLAKTTSIPASLALKYGAKIHPIRIYRINKHQHRLEILPALELEKDDDVMSITTKINDIISSWIVEHKEQWLWIHKRWDKKNYQKSS